VKLTVLGGSGAWPTAQQGCSGYVVEENNFTLLLDPGYATLPVLLARMPADAVDAVYVTHGHPDHCADLNPLLRARALTEPPAPVLDVWAQPGSLDAVLALDRPAMLAASYDLHDVVPGATFPIGPFEVTTFDLPHWLPNVAVRLSCRAGTIAYTGDTGPSPTLVDMARDADILVADATYVDHVPDDSASYLSSARAMGELAAAAGVRHLVLTHLWPGTNPVEARAAAKREFTGRIDVAAAGLNLWV
jgi:ribonuclease BN (tRNA processing enzyme)